MICAWISEVSMIFRKGYYGYLLVVYHLHGQTGRSTVKANGKKNSVAFTICTNQFRLPENDRERLKLLSKMSFKKWNTNFRLEYSVRKNRTTFSDVPLFPEMFGWNDQKSRVPLLSNWTFRKLVEMVNNHYNMEIPKMSLEN